MDKPNGWDEVQAAKMSIKKPCPGSYVLVIVNAYVGYSKTDERMLNFEFDIAEGEYKGFYSEYSKSFKSNRYLKHGQLVDMPSAMPFFKRIIQAIEESNPGFKYNWHESTLIGKKLGVTMRNEEFISKRTGMLDLSLKIAAFVDVESARKGNLSIPATKRLSDKNYNAQNNSFEFESRAGDLPFD